MEDLFTTRGDQVEKHYWRRNVTDPIAEQLASIFPRNWTRRVNICLLKTLDELELKYLAQKGGASAAAAVPMAGPSTVPVAVPSAAPVAVPSALPVVVTSSYEPLPSPIWHNVSHLHTGVPSRLHSPLTFDMCYTPTGFTSTTPVPSIRPGTPGPLTPSLVTPVPTPAPVVTTHST